MKYKILPMSEKYIEPSWHALDSVAKERKYLAFLEGPPLEKLRAFVLGNLKENRPHYIALIEEQVVGWCDISSLNRPVYAHSGSLGMGVIMEYRGHGIGEALIRAALAHAKSTGLSRVELTVHEENKPAIALYEKMGFTVEGLKRNAVKIDNEYINNICMAILFSK